MKKNNLVVAVVVAGLFTAMACPTLIEKHVNKHNKEKFSKHLDDLEGEESTEVETEEA